MTLRELYRHFCCKPKDLHALRNAGLIVDGLVETTIVPGGIVQNICLQPVDPINVITVPIKVSE